MQKRNLIPLLILIGVSTLFFFPNPQENFLLYISTALSFIILLILLIKSKNKNSD